MITNNLNTIKEYTIDATGKPLGRLSTEVAVLLNAKNSTAFVKNLVANIKVKVINASKVKITGLNKMKDNMHKTYSGYPGGLYQKSWKYVVEKDGFGELIKHAVSGMLPKNKLHDKRLMNLSTEE